jgi:hypothetical protein
MNSTHPFQSDTDSHDLTALCAAHLSHEKVLLAAALPVVRAVQVAFSLRRHAALAAALSGHQEVAKLIEEMRLRRQHFREAAARRLGIDPKDTTLARVLAGLPEAARAAIAQGAAQVRRLADELAATNYSVSIFSRIYLDAYRRILRELTNSAASSGRYRPAGGTESLDYRPLIQIHG